MRLVGRLHTKCLLCLPLQILVQALVTENFELSRRATKESVKVRGTCSWVTRHRYVIATSSLLVDRSIAHK
jgi:hypothetical protein